ncbi:MAG: hypothetical protein M3454_17255 [Actinomycetota bacterium]|nr:hypothetical protein [Actinomycetota bacterium]
MSKYRAQLGLIFAVAGLATFVGAYSPAAAGGNPGNHCITPAGDDLNEYFASDDALIAPFCTQVRKGDRWRAIVLEFVPRLELRVR